MWLRNPINGFWYSLRYDKDRFSTLVQSSAAYVFDLWISKIFTRRKQLVATFHDELIVCIKEGNRDKCSELLTWAINETNKELNLNRELAIDIQYGQSYDQIH